MQNDLKFDRNNYIVPFDGLRVFAVLSVFFYHLTPHVVKSGYLGVVIFFVLAGFLQSANRNDNDNILNKIFNKLLKLYPPLIITITIVTIAMMLLFKSFLPSYPMEALSSLFSFNNYYQILKEESYFEAMNSIKPLTHMWALSLEFQFYIIFYSIINVFSKKSSKKVFLITLSTLTVISIALSILFIIFGFDLTRVYYGLDTRIGTFLIGIIAYNIALNFKSLISSNIRIFRIIELLIIIGLIAITFINFDTNIWIILSLNIHSIVFAILLIILYNEYVYITEKKLKSRNKKTRRERIIYNLLSLDIHSYIVRRSYIIYLTHYPVIIFANRTLSHYKINNILFVLIIIFVTVIITELIYQLIELSKKISYDKKLYYGFYSLLTILCIMSIFTSIKISPKSEEINYGDKEIIDVQSEIREKPSEDVSSEEEVVIASVSELPVVSTKSEVEISTISVANNVSTKSTVKKTKAQVEKENILNAAIKRINKINKNIGGVATLDVEEFKKFNEDGIKFNVIGDSVASCARGSMTLYLPGSYVDTKGNRKIEDAVSVLKSMKEKGEVGDAVVIALGTNSVKDINTNELLNIYNEVQALEKGKPMIIMTIVLPYNMQEKQRNKSLIEFADKYDYCYIADWNASAKTHKDLFMDDGIHPTGIGNDLYAQLLVKAYIDAKK